MQIIQMYQTNDGKTFSDRLQAEAHEKAIRLKELDVLIFQKVAWALCKESWINPNETITSPSEVEAFFVKLLNYCFNYSCRLPFKNHSCSTYIALQAPECVRLNVCAYDQFWKAINTTTAFLRVLSNTDRIQIEHILDVYDEIYKKG